MRVWTIVGACFVVAVFACQSIPDIQFYPDPPDGSSGGPASSTSGEGSTSSGSTSGSTSGTSGSTSGTSGVPDPVVDCPATPPPGGVCCDTRPCYKCTVDMCLKCAECGSGMFCCRQGGSAKVMCAASLQACPN